MPAKVRGPFDVKLTPQPSNIEHPDPTLGRMTIAKTYHGDLEGTGVGEMLTAMTPVKGSAVYVAVERVTGTLQGRRGAFTIHHEGIMTRGTPALSVRVVPDSGEGDLAGIAGTMKIHVESDGHSYEFEYTLPGDAG